MHVQAACTSRKWRCCSSPSFCRNRQAESQRRPTACRGCQYSFTLPHRYNCQASNQANSCSAGRRNATHSFIIVSCLNMCKRCACSWTIVLLLSLAQALSVPCEHKEDFSLLVRAAGWYIAAVLTGAYKLPSLRERTVGRATSTAARAWLLAVPVSLSTSCTPQMAFFVMAQNLAAQTDKSKSTLTDLFLPHHSKHPTL